MSFTRIATMVVAATLTTSAQNATLPGVSAVMQEMVARQEVPGSVTAVVSKDRVLHQRAGLPNSDGSDVRLAFQRAAAAALAR